MDDNDKMNIKFAISQVGSKRRVITVKESMKSLFDPTLIPDPNIETSNDQSGVTADELEADETEKDFQLKATECKDIACNFASDGDFINALRTLMKGSYLDPTNHLLQDLLAQVYLQLNRFDDAVKAAERCVAISPTWIEGYLTLARSRREMGETFPKDEEALAEYKEMCVIHQKLEAALAENQAALRPSMTEEEREVKTCIGNLLSRVKLV